MVRVSAYAVIRRGANYHPQENNTSGTEKS